MGKSDDPKPDGPAAKQTADDASLDEVLTDLEQILDVQSAEEAGVEQSPAGAQYTIPLLDDVVVPGSQFPQDQDDTIEPAPIISIELDEESQAVISRLSNEIEVIVQAAMEDTLRRANKEIASKVRKHMNIVLEEILDELADIKSRKGL